MSELTYLITQSRAFQEALSEAVGVLEGIPDNPRFTVPMDALVVAAQHAAGLGTLMESDLFVSAVGLLRMQYEAVLRATWAYYAAAPQELLALAAPLTVGTVKAAKSLGMAADLLEKVEKSQAPPDLKRSLREIRTSAWDMMNSYIHAGIHPLRRYDVAVEFELINVLRVSNGLSMLTAGLMVALAGQTARQQDINLVCIRFGDCLPRRHHDTTPTQSSPGA